MGSGNSQQPALVSSLRQEFLITKEKCDFSNPFWRKRFSQVRMKNTIRCRRILMKRRARPRINPIERKVRILKKLINPKCESMISVKRLFRETAQYIVALQTRVKLMQITVDALSGSGDHDHK